MQMKNSKAYVAQQKEKNKRMRFEKEPRKFEEGKCSI